MKQENANYVSSKVIEECGGDPRYVAGMGRRKFERMQKEAVEAQKAEFDNAVKAFAKRSGTGLMVNQ